MKESRGSKYGRNLALWVSYTIDTMPENQRETYRTSLIEELQTYSFTPRKKGSPKNSGSVHELSDIIEVDTTNPENLAKLIKEGIHLMYQKQTASRVFKALLANLQL